MATIPSKGPTYAYVQSYLSHVVGDEALKNVDAAVEMLRDYHLISWSAQEGGLQSYAAVKEGLEATKLTSNEIERFALHAQARILGLIPKTLFLKDGPISLAPEEQLFLKNSPFFKALLEGIPEDGKYTTAHLSQADLRELLADFTDSKPINKLNELTDLPSLKQMSAKAFRDILDKMFGPDAIKAPFTEDEVLRMASKLPHQEMKDEVNGYLQKKVDICQSAEEFGEIVKRYGTHISSLKLPPHTEDEWLGHLKNIPKLVSLDVSHTKITTFVPLGALNLKSLNISGSQVLDSKPLARLKNLEVLKMAKSAVSDLTFFNGLLKLTSLDLSECSWQAPEGSISPLTPLAPLKNLLDLNLSNVNSFDISPLAGLEKLTTLNMADCKNLIDLDPLKSLPNLTSVRISGVIFDITPLSFVRSLEYLDVSGSHNLDQLPPMENLTSLRYLNLTGRNSHLMHIEPLSGLNSSLEVLVLDICTHLHDLTPIANLSIKKLSIRGLFTLRDLAPVGTLLDLISLNMGGCVCIESIEPLRHLKKLETLDLSSCYKVKDINPLVDIPELKALDAQDCPADLSPLEGKPGLEILTNPPRQPDPPL